MKSTVARLTLVSISLIVLGLILTGQSYAGISPEFVVGVWLFDEGEGDVAKDSSNKGSDGKVVGEPKWVEGKFGKALNFDGTDDYYVDCGDDKRLNPSSAMTIVSWMNVKSYAGVREGGQRTIFERRDYLVDDNAYQLILFPAGDPNEGKLRFSFWSSGAEKFIDSTDTVTLNQWYHVAVTYDGSKAKIYLNGKQNTVADISGGIDLKNIKTIIGAGGQGMTNFFNGTIDEIAVFNVALTNDEINRIMKEGLYNGLGKEVVSSLLQRDTSSLMARATTSTPSAGEEMIGNLKNLGYVVVSPEGPRDGGDFGPYTKGSRTSGIQEALNYAKDNRKSVYIVGGGVKEAFKNPVVYHVNTTLTVPWGQDWEITGGDYIMNFTITNGDCLVFDSQMNCTFKFGLIVATQLKNGSVVKIWPHTVGPDNFKVFTSCIVHINAIVGGGNVFGKGVEGQGTGLHLDASSGSIIHSKILVMEINACKTGILLDGGGIINNTIDAPFTHVCNSLLQVNTGSFNKIDAMLDSTGVGGPVTGANLAGGNENIYTLMWSGKFPDGKVLIFGTESKDNLVYAMNLPLNGVTNKAIIPTNRIVSLKPVGFNVSSPAVPRSNVNLVNQEPYSVVIIILEPGSVSSWTITDSNGKMSTISGPLFAGQSIYLEPGDKINLNYTRAPVWKWRALR